MMMQLFQLRSVLWVIDTQSQYFPPGVCDVHPWDFKVGVTIRNGEKATAVPMRRGFVIKLSKLFLNKALSSPSPKRLFTTECPFQSIKRYYKWNCNLHPGCSSVFNTLPFWANNILQKKQLHIIKTINCQLLQAIPPPLILKRAQHPFMVWMNYCR